MAYDETLVERIRACAGPQQPVSEMRMFGGLAFLVDGNMAVAASGQGGLMVRVDPLETDRLIASTAATAFEMRGRPMAGWLRVAHADVERDAELAPWVQRGIAYARSLPPKR